MSIVHDYAAVGTAYRKLSDGWLPREEQPKPHWTDKVTANAKYGTVAINMAGKRKPIDATVLENLFDRYVLYATHWLNGQEYFCPLTGLNMSVELLDHELANIELATRGPRGRAEFRKEFLIWRMRVAIDHRDNGGPKPAWDLHPRYKAFFENAAALFSHEITG